MLAIPLFGNEVAPRFAGVTRFAVADIHQPDTPAIQYVTLPEIGWSCRLQQLAGLGVTILLCSGFNRRFLPFAHCLGMQVFTGLVGRAEDLVTAYCRHKLERFNFSQGAYERHPAEQESRSAR